MGLVGVTPGGWLSLRLDKLEDEIQTVSDDVREVEHGYGEIGMHVEAVGPDGPVQVIPDC